MFVVGEAATGVTTLQAKKVGTSAKIREVSEGSRSLSRGDAPTQSLGCRRGMSQHLERKLSLLASGDEARSGLRSRRDHIGEMLRS